MMAREHKPKDKQAYHNHAGAVELGECFKALNRPAIKFGRATQIPESESDAHVNTPKRNSSRTTEA